MKSNEYLAPKRRKVSFAKQQADKVERVAVDYGVAIFKREFDGFGKGALDSSYEDFDNDAPEALKNDYKNVEPSSEGD